MSRKWLIERYIAAAILPYLSLALLLLTAILFAQQAGRFAEILGATRAPLDIVLEIALGLAPNVLLFTLPMATLAGTVIGFSRMNSDSEVVAMRAAGTSPRQMFTPALLLGAALSVCSLYLGIEVVPGAAKSLREVAVRAALIKLQSPVDPRVFNTEIPGKIIYVREGDEANNLWRGVFIRAEDGGKEVLVTARAGRIDSSGGQAELVLTDAQAISLPAATDTGRQSQSITVDRLAQSRFKLDTGSNAVLERWRTREPIADELEWKTLVARAYVGDERDGAGTHAAMMALHKKLALCVAPLAFAFLGANLGMRLRRGGRGAGTLWSVAVMLLYYLTMLAGEQLARTGNSSLTVWVGEWLATGLVMLLGTLLWFREMYGGGGGKWGALRSVENGRGGEVKEGRSIRRYLPPLTGLLDRSVLRALTFNFAGVYTALVGIFLVFTLFELWRSIAANNVAAAVVLRYLFFLLPFVSVSLAPVCLLVAVLATYAVMARRSEAIAWWAGGQSLYRLALPGIVFAFCVSGGMWLVQEKLLAAFNQRQDTLRMRIKGERVKVVTSSGRQWLASADGLKLYSYEFNEAEGTLINPVVYRLDPSMTHVERLTVGARGIWSEKGTMKIEAARTLDVTGRSSNSSVAFTAPKDVELTDGEPPEVFKPLLNRPSHLSGRGLSDYLVTLKRRGMIEAAPLYAVALARRRSDPLMPLVMCLIGVPLALAFGRKSALSALGSAVASGLAFWGVTGGFQQLGIYGLLPAAIAAWSPLVIFLALGTYLMARART
jgi:lipopolysaccharide export system permease protein